MQCTQCGKAIGKRNITPYCKRCSARRVIKALHQKAIGQKRSKEVCKKISEGKLAEKNPMWRGNSVGLLALHNWVRRRLPKPPVCPKCNERPAMDLANKGIYDRNLKNWKWLCRKCHIVEDGRMAKAIKKLNAHATLMKGKKKIKKYNDGLTDYQRYCRRKAGKYPPLEVQNG